MFCKKCLEDISPDCMLSNGLCVFCYYNTKTWESNGKTVYQYCGRRAPDVALEVDHIIPLSKGGTDKPSNLITACFECNSQKRNKLTLEES
jgi:5-methylcytosine-specific restriction endonuclease McrA